MFMRYMFRPHRAIFRQHIVEKSTALCTLSTVLLKYIVVINFGIAWCLCGRSAPLWVCLSLGHVFHVLICVPCTDLPLLGIKLQLSSPYPVAILSPNKTALFFDGFWRSICLFPIRHARKVDYGTQNCVFLYTLQWKRIREQIVLVQPDRAVAFPHDLTSTSEFTHGFRIVPLEIRGLFPFSSDLLSSSPSLSSSSSAFRIRPSGLSSRFKEYS
jgi:hypothetical protein